jgi:hypothetical protein
MEFMRATLYSNRMPILSSLYTHLLHKPNAYGVCAVRRVLFSNLSLTTSNAPSSQLSSILDCADQQLRSVFLQHRLVVVFPELLGGVLACDPLQDLGTAGVLVNERCTRG